MKKNILICLPILLCLLQTQSFSASTACTNNVSLDALDYKDPFILQNLSDIEAYATCKAALKEDVNICNMLPEGFVQKANCKEDYNKFYASFGRLFKYGRFMDNECTGKLGSQEACDHFAKAMILGQPDECAQMPNTTTHQNEDCKNMASSHPSGDKAKFMNVLRQGNPAVCDSLPSKAAAAMCRGLLTKGSDGCETSEAILKFKDSYCQHLSSK